MTERESEQLYHDLRRKLEGYGSAPPDAMWANIQAQLPARPRRRWRPLLLVLLVGTALTCLTVGTRSWRAGSRGAQSPDAGILAGAARSAGPRLASGQTGASPAATANPGSPAAAASGTNTAASGTAALGTAAPASGSGVPLGALPAETVRPRHALTSTGSTTASRCRPGRLPAVAGLLEPAEQRTRTRRARRHPETAGLSDRAGGTVEGAASLLARQNRPKRGATVGISSEEETAADYEEQLVAATNKSGKKTGKLRLSNAPLALRTVRPPALDPEEPEVRAKRRPRVRPTRRELRLRGWSVQALAGAGLTYRALGGSPTQLEQLERPSVGFSGQVTGAYAFTRQLTLAAGLGYTEYATALRYQLKKSSSDATQTTEFRDVYRFLAVPLQAQYTLQGNHRWRLGVLGGGTVALLAGARTTEGSACNCRQRQWSSGPTSPFRATSLLLNAGAFANYQFAPGQWFTLRPQGQIFLNSLTTEASGRSARRPWSLGIQAGYSWDLDPRKH